MGPAALHELALIRSAPGQTRPPRPGSNSRSEARSLPQLLVLLSAQVVNLVYQVRSYRLLSSVTR